MRVTLHGEKGETAAESIMAASRFRLGQNFILTHFHEFENRSGN